MPASRLSRRGNSGQFHLKPVISAVPWHLTSACASPATLPRRWRMPQRGYPCSHGVPVRSTAPESSGRFVLYPCQRALTICRDVQRSGAGGGDWRAGRPTAPTTVSSTGRPLDPPPSIERGVAGTLNPPTQRCSASSAERGRSIEVGWRPCAQSGRFAFIVCHRCAVRRPMRRSSGACVRSDPTSMARDT